MQKNVKIEVMEKIHNTVNNTVFSILQVLR